MTTTLVTGATGRLGRPTVARLRAAGHDVRALSRRSGPGLATGDLRTGAGLREALTGVGTVVHLATGPRGRGDVDLARTLLTAVAEADVDHLVLVSIVGIDTNPLPYYRDKLAVERLVGGSGVPHTVLRATQFHALVAGLFTVQRALPVLAAPAVPLQPIAVEDVAERLVELAGSAPAGRVGDIGGPEQLTVPELARVWTHGTGSRRRVVPVRLPGRVFAALHAGSALVPGVPYGRRTFAEHVAATAARTGTPRTGTGAPR
ncbi:SDR family oxidoreductase [Cellulomonas aerilata]|uniref:Nucleotide-diphosphate-sugar epimerase n=1 Tax=Cellulomonas aerilata TaxID=515326 RepID=A0A512DDL2_9CELL|nr:NAD(P)H-binding protein [Cellulomonas aerilata]GEO34566.1 nucleotide-diphosphate-sugar epimerase [Cellulomonas aerilata]